MNKSKKFLWLALTLLTVVALMPTRVAALEYHHARLLVNEDALVNQSQSSKNYGSSVDLLVGDVVAGWHDLGLCRSYLKFDVGGSLPAGAVVTNAELLLMLHETYPGLRQRTIESCYVPNDSWTEGTINWSNAPAYNVATTGTITSTFNSPNSYYCWNVTPDVITAMGDNGVYSTAMVIKGEPAAYWNNFYSRDWPILPDKRPYLEIVYTLPGKVIPSGSEGYNPSTGSGIGFGPGMGLGPIPPDFFGPGSDPFEGQIALSGAGTPMLVEREAVYIPDSTGEETVDTEIVELSLRSTAPITVTYGGGPDSFFDVYVELETSSPGTALVNTSGGGSGGGGYIYQDTPLLQLHLEFVNVDTQEKRDLYIPGADYTQQIIMTPSTEITWQTDPDKEAQLLGYDGFYASERQTISSALTYDSMPTGGLNYSTLSEVSAEFCITTEEQWLEALSTEQVRAVTTEEWDDFITQFNQYAPDNDCDPYPETTFIPAELYVCGPEGGGGMYSCDCNYPQDAGLVMMWGNGTEANGDYASAFKYVYAEDPDLTGCVVTTTVYPPCGMLVVSLAISDINGNIRAWYWNVAPLGGPTPPGTIPCSNVPGPGPGATPTNISVDLSKTGVGAATPVAASYANNPAFDITKAQDFKFDENNNFIAQTQIPAPGSGIVANWNYWKNIVVTKKTPPQAVDSKFYVKWSQKPDVIDPNEDPKTIWGWDERSNYHWRPIIADDWLCEDDRPVTDIHWWGSYIGWNQPFPPPIVPQAFHIGIWMDTPVGADPDADFSHPLVLIWENYCDSWVWNFYGYDIDPHWTGSPDPTVGEPLEPWETCFQFNQLLSEDEWFYQDPCEIWLWGDSPTDPYPKATVYWLSIAAVYDPNIAFIPHPWGWKTRRPTWNDDAVRIWEVEPPTIDWPAGFPPPNWPPSRGYNWKMGDPIWWPDVADSWDMCFELTTNEPKYKDAPIPGDLYPVGDPDGIINWFDVSVLADHWLDTSP